MAGPHRALEEPALTHPLNRPFESRGQYRGNSNAHTRPADSADGRHRLRGQPFDAATGGTAAAAEMPRPLAGQAGGKSCPRDRTGPRRRAGPQLAGSRAGGCSYGVLPDPPDGRRRGLRGEGPPRRRDVRRRGRGGRRAANHLSGRSWRGRRPEAVAAPPQPSRGGPHPPATPTWRRSNSAPRS